MYQTLVVINAVLVNGLHGNYKEAAVLNAVEVNKFVVVHVSVYVIYPHLWTTAQERLMELFHATLNHVQYGSLTAAAAAAAVVAAAAAAAAAATVEAAAAVIVEALIPAAMNNGMKDGGTIKLPIV
jgi:hypothetical protein